MLINKILGLGEDECVFLAEESLQDLLWLPVTQNLIRSLEDFDHAVAIKDKALALYSEPQDLWILMTDRYSEIKPVRELTGSMNCKVVDVPEELFFQAIVECLSVSLREGIFCESCIESNPLRHPEDRISSLVNLLSDRVNKSYTVLEIGCGSGAGTLALRRIGIDPWAMDINRCEVCQGLRINALNPQRTFVLDARLLPRFFAKESFDLVAGFMVGLIDLSNWHIWREIIIKSSSLARHMVLYTVYSKREAEMIAGLLDGLGWKGELIDNSGSVTIYDQWAYLGIH